MAFELNDFEIDVCRHMSDFSDMFSSQIKSNEHGKRLLSHDKKKITHDDFMTRSSSLATKWQFSALEHLIIAEQSMLMGSIWAQSVWLWFDFWFNTKSLTTCWMFEASQQPIRSSRKECRKNISWDTRQFLFILHL